ncbi:hypothetical protein LHL20_19920 [Alteromonas sp. McT4-15]|uniref:DUF6575 domain-containing protein n=1 Tax=Alteromonas sp. McT4-15 TaxID=2881256 RepID=UPI001CF887B9|nr:DUF6575 domain-containing protein [Alteromonas sp. McT4-15]MCB4438501.1 hypothetical protein [Alteromonas sp. McT4-15]
MFILPKLNELGTSKLLKVYHRYDIPRTFLVRTKKLGDCVAFWFDEDHTHDSWYYAPVNSDEIERLERGDIQLRDVFTHKHLYQVKTGYCENSVASIEKVNLTNIDIEALPPVGFGVKALGNGEFDIEQRDPETFTLNSHSHEIRLKRPRSKKLIEWEPIEFILGAWKTLHNNILESVQNISEDVAAYPGVANTGSYKMQFRSSHNNEVYIGVEKVFSAIKSAQGSLTKLNELNVDLSILEQLLLNLAEYNLQFEIRTNSGALVNTLDYKLIERTMHSLSEFNQQKISSDKIPQANEIERVITYIQKKARCLPFTSETEEISHRQIGYYKTASDLLGLSSKGQLTPSGWRLSELESEQDIFGLLCDRFETSQCGWAWLKYSEVRSALDLDPDTAEAFLRSHSTGLSESTLVRRASTLRKWPLVFREKLLQ